MYSGRTLGSASSINDATKAVEGLNKLMQTADPFMKATLQTAKTMISMNPAMLDSALAIVPEPFKSQIKATLGPSNTPSKQTKTAAAAAAAPFNWKPWAIGGGVVGGSLALLLVLRKRKKG